MQLSPTESANLAEHLTRYIAEQISSAIDAGSERDAIMEDLLSFMRLYVDTWSDPQGSSNLQAEWFMESMLKAVDNYAICLYG